VFCLQTTTGRTTNEMDDSRRLDALIKLLKSCISPRSANKNILPPRDTSRCWRTICEKPLKCHNFVTLDSANQSARFYRPLQESAVGFRTPVTKARSRLNHIFGGFFYARLAWLQMVAGQGHLRVRRIPLAGVLTLFGPPPRLEPGLVGNNPSKESAMLEFSQALSGGMNIVPRFSFFSDFLRCYFSCREERNEQV